MGHFWRLKDANWRSIATALGTASVVTIIFPWTMVGISLAQNAITPCGECGWGLLLLVPFLDGGIGVAVANILAVLIYLATHKPSRKAIIICVLAILISVADFALFFTHVL